jgi:hypothetical protein
VLARVLPGLALLYSLYMAGSALWSLYRAFPWVEELLQARVAAFAAAVGPVVASAVDRALAVGMLLTTLLAPLTVHTSRLAASMWRLASACSRCGRCCSPLAGCFTRLAALRGGCARLGQALAAPIRAGAACCSLIGSRCGACTRAGAACGVLAGRAYRSVAALGLVLLAMVLKLASPFLWLATAVLSRLAVVGSAISAAAAPLWECRRARQAAAATAQVAQMVQEAQASVPASTAAAASRGLCTALTAALRPRRDALVTAGTGAAKALKHLLAAKDLTPAVRATLGADSDGGASDGARRSPRLATPAAAGSTPVAAKLPFSPPAHSSTMTPGADGGTRLRPTPAVAQQGVEPRSRSPSQSLRRRRSIYN